MLRVLLLFPLAAFAQTVDLELMTYPEVAAAIRGGKTTVLVYNGGTEQRGPHAVLGGHTILAKATVAAIARKLGNALAAPVLPFSPAGSHVNPRWPGSIGISEELFGRMNEAIVDSLAVAGFRNIIVMGDHGGGQKELEAVAHRTNAKYASKGIHVAYSGAIHNKARLEIDEWLKQQHLPLSTHAGIPDTSELMYLGGDRYVRKDRMAPGDGKNGVSGDPRPSTPEMGKRFFDMRVDDAVAEIRRLVK